MNDIEAANKVLAQLQDQRDRATDRVRQIEDQRQSLAYAVYAGGNEKQRAELTALNNRLAELAAVIEDIDIAFVEAQQRLVSVREHIKSDKSFVIQERRPDSGGAAADVDDRKPCSL